MQNEMLMNVGMDNADASVKGAHRKRKRDATVAQNTSLVSIGNNEDSLTS